MRVLSIFGTRPEAIKMAPVVLELAKVGTGVESVVCVTAQHREMLDQVLLLFGIRPDIDLDLMKPDQRLDDFTAKAVRELGRVIEDVGPDVALVQGDATTAMAGAMAAFYQKIPVGHVEAGLRTGHPYSPFPEEINRRIISSVARFHFAPTRKAADALVSESVPFNTVFIVGNTVIDALHSIHRRLTEMDLGRFDFNGRKLILLTSHRRENFGDPLRGICRAAAEIAARNKHVEIVFPVHPNPNVRSIAREMLDGVDRVHLCDPLSYGDLVAAMSQCHLILTDSGGIQEEASCLGKPVLILRDRTERLEAVEARAAKIVGTETENVVHEAECLLNGGEEYAEMARPRTVFGDGLAAKRIVSILLGEVGGHSQPRPQVSVTLENSATPAGGYASRLFELLRYFPHSQTGRRWIAFNFLIGICSAVLAFALSGHLAHIGPPHIGVLAGAAIWSVALVSAVGLCGFHYPRNRISLYETFVLAALSVAIAAAMELAFLSALLYRPIGRRILWIQVLLALFLLGLLRLFFLRWLRSRPKRVLVYSPHGHDHELTQLIAQSAVGHELVGRVRDDPDTGLLDCHIRGLVARGLDLLEMCRKVRAQELIYSNGKVRSPAADARVAGVLESGIPVTMAWQYCERLFRYTPSDSLPPGWPLQNCAGALNDSYKFFRNGLDIAAALALGAALAPAWLIIAIAIRVLYGGPVIYRQPRIGLNGKKFVIYKFRTMRHGHEEDVPESFTNERDPRVPFFGRVLRRTRIDELPQLLNILKGDMVLIGPRPEQPGFAAKYAEELPFYKYRHLVKPGITGWAQVKYRYTNDLEGTRKKLGYDLYYIRHMSLKLDIEVVLRTIVFLMKGAV